MYGRIEFAYAQMARLAGINMPQTRLFEENGRAHFMTPRFDRPQGTRRLHMLTLCGIAHLDFKAVGVHDYAQFQAAIDALGLGMEAKQEAFRRMVFNYVGMNCDDHTKNQAFLMDERGTWSLAPAYDITFAYSPTSSWVNQHLMAVDGKFMDVSGKDALGFAGRHGIQGAKAIIRQVNDAFRQWPVFAGEAGLPREVTSQIGAFHIRMAS
jgi:serine/threonine-protein kinase HipA